MSGTASSTVNFPIDTPVSGVSMEDRPLLNMLLEVDEYRERYHGYLREIVGGYFESGLFERTVTAIDARINEYVKNDAGAYYTYEQYEASLPVFIELGCLRAESIKGQLERTIPSTSVEQNANSSALVDASHINLSALGSMMGGGGMGRGDFNTPDGNFGGMPGGMGGMFGGDMTDMNVMMEAMQIIMNAGGELTNEDLAALLELGLTEEQIEMFSSMQNGFPGGDRQGGFPGGDRQGGFPGGDAGGGQGNPPNGNADIPAQGLNRPSGNTTGTAPQSNDITGYVILIAILILLLAGAILFIAKPRKKLVLSSERN